LEEIIERNEKKGEELGTEMAPMEEQIQEEEETIINEDQVHLAMVGHLLAFKKKGIYFLILRLISKLTTPWEICGIRQKRRPQSLQMDWKPAKKKINRSMFMPSRDSTFLGLKRIIISPARLFTTTKLSK
jgi:hypothetical protein